VIQHGKGKSFAMGRAIAVRAEYTSKQLRGLATRVKDAAQARRLLAIAAVLDGHSRAEAAKIGGMDRQTLRDWVIRFNAQGPAGLVNTPSPGGAPQAFRRAQGVSGPDR
jgi:Winged helix-turn helix